jgi:uncharacterized membrane protein
MIWMFVGLAVLLGTHAFTSARQARAAAIGRLGWWPYMILYSLVSLIGLGLVAWGYGDWRASGPTQLWDPPLWTRHLALGLMLAASVLLVAAFVPSHLRDRLKYPALIAIETWAVAHLFANGDLATVVLALAVLGWAIYAHFSVKKRTEEPGPAPGTWTGDAIAGVAGLALLLLLAYIFHPYIIGVPVIP